MRPINSSRCVPTFKSGAIWCASLSTANTVTASIPPRSSTARAEPSLASCIFVWPEETVMLIEPDRSITIPMATASLRCSLFNSIETGSSGSTADSKYPPEPKLCFPPTMRNPPPCSVTKKSNASRNSFGISYAGTLFRMTALDPAR